MDLLYGIDLYGSAREAASAQTYLAAIKRFAALDKALQGRDRVELYVGACSIVGWDDSFRERWFEFAQGVCTPEKLGGLQAESAVEQALVLAMMPVAMTIAESREGFVLSAELALTWLAQAEALAKKLKRREDLEFFAFFGVTIHTMNALCLDAFEEPDAADAEIDAALKVLRLLERRIGVSGKSTPLRRSVVESLFKTGRTGEAKKMLRQMLVRADADPAGRRIPLAEQVAILSLAARLEHDEREAARERECTPEEPGNMI